MTLLRCLLTCWVVGAGVLGFAAETSADSPAWAAAHLEEPMTADETRAFLRELAQFVFDNHLKKTADSPQRGLVYEYLDVKRKGQFDQFVQGEALDTMHDGAWLAAALAGAHRATGEPFYKQFLAEWQLPFYLKMLNHSDELFNTAHNHARPDRQKLWTNSKEWLLQPGEKGFVPYFWDDGGSVSLEMRKDKNPGLSFPGFDRFAQHDKPNPNYLLDGYSFGSSNHLAQDLGVMLQQAWLLLKDSSSAADQDLARQVALGARHLHECRMRHHGHIPMSDAPAALANADAELMKHVPARDTAALWTPANHYVKALYSFKPGERAAFAGFADDQQYNYYAGIARHGGKLPKPLAFKVVYDALTEPLLYRCYSDDAPVPAGINRFDLHPYYAVDGKPTDYRSDRKGPSGQPRPIGSRMGPQNMICCGWALQALEEYPGLWEERHRRDFADDLRVFIVDPPPPRQTDSAKPPPASELKLGDVQLNLISTRLALQVRGVCSGDRVTIKLFSGPKGQGSFAQLAVGRDQSISVTNDKGEILVFSGRAKPMGKDFKFELELPYTVAKEQKAWANGIEHGRYSVQVGEQVRNYYLASHESQVQAMLQHELAGGLRTWQAIFREKGYIPTGMGAGFVWDDFSDNGGYAHLIAAGTQWLLCLEGKRDWQMHRVPDVLAMAQAPAAAVQSPEEKERQRILKWEPQIAAYEVQDKQQPTLPGGIVFVGSSSIRLWDLQKSFGELPAINRGFGGSQLADSAHYADRLVTRHQPRIVVVYAGDNDLNAGKSPEQVSADFKALARRIHARLPEAKIVFIGIKPSIARWKNIDNVRCTNGLIQQFIAGDKRLVFVDVDKPMLNEAGLPRPELFVKDGLHMTPAGYAVWAELLKPHLEVK
jgi:lysophospholipase L1-like esterase